MSRNAFSSSSLLVIAVLLVAVVSLSQILFRGWRIDLTENNLYTLSDGTKSELWRSCLLALAIALLLEQVLAWRAGHHRPNAAGPEQSFGLGGVRPPGYGGSAE